MKPVTPSRGPGTGISGEMLIFMTSFQYPIWTYINHLMTLTLMWSISVHSTVAVTQIKVGVMMGGDLALPYSVQRTGPAVDIAIDKVNTRVLNESYQLTKVLRVYDTICDARFASGVAAELYYKEHIQLLVGPGCSAALDSVARLAAFWNIPVVTGMGDGGMFKNKTTYPTLTRFSYCQCRLRKVFASVFKTFEWHDIAIIYDVNDEYANVLGETLKTGLQENRYYPYVSQFYSASNPDIAEHLRDVSQRSRIILLIMSGDLLRVFMLVAYDLGYPQSGNYVFMNVVLFDFPGRYWGNNDWFRNDSRDHDARIAFTSVLRIGLHLPRSIDWNNFTGDCIELSEKEYNFTYGEEEVNFFVGSFHDAVLRYGEAINMTLTLGADINDGRAVTHRMWNHTTLGVTGDIIIDDNGDRDTNFAIKDMDPLTGEFKIVAMYWGAQPGYTPENSTRIHWAGGRLTPPSNTPVCGFTHDDPACENAGSIPAYMIIIIALFGVTVVTAFVGLLVYRRVRWEKDLNSTAWRVSFADIQFRHTVGQSGKMSAYSLRTKESNDTQSENKGQSFTMLGIYKGETVAAKQVRMYKIDLNRAVLLELKLVRGIHHENTAKFIGACVEPGQIFLLYEYCKKGSLQDVLLADTLKLDWTFKISLLRDIVKGVSFIHQTELGYHGRLTSANCLVDGKFNVKITDFGLPSFRKVELKDNENFQIQHSELQKLLWVAPEHIQSLQLRGGSKKGDIYSFAIIMEEVVTRSVPYDTRRIFMEVEDIICRVCSDENPPFRPEILDVDVLDTYIKLMENCWAQKPEDRPGFDTIFKVLNSLNGGKEVALVDRLLARLEEYTSNLEDLVEERTQQLAQEKRKSEMLLDEILPRAVSEKLKQGQPVDPEFYDMVSIYFSDIVGFTSLSAMSTPLEVVGFLNALYSSFDAAIENLDVYKIETIGDAYMVASGLPLRNGNNHVLHIARLAIQLRQVVEDFVVPHKPEKKLMLRIGLNSGPVVAGVVGLKMPRYCLFGDTVNTASRMESNGQARKIHISQSTKDLLDQVGHFEIERRGDIEMKGKGVQTTYWLLREFADKGPEITCMNRPKDESEPTENGHLDIHAKHSVQKSDDAPGKNTPRRVISHNNNSSKESDKTHIQTPMSPHPSTIGEAHNSLPQFHKGEVTSSPITSTKQAKDREHKDSTDWSKNSIFKITRSTLNLPHSPQPSQFSLLKNDNVRNSRSSLKDIASPKISTENAFLDKYMSQDNGYRMSQQTSAKLQSTKGFHNEKKQGSHNRVPECENINIGSENIILNRYGLKDYSYEMNPQASFQLDNSTDHFHNENSTDQNGVQKSKKISNVTIIGLPWLTLKK